MSETKNINNLFERYVYQVGKYLPKRKQKDIQTEIFSSLKDALEGQATLEGKEPDEQMAINLIKDFGPPKKVATSFLPNKFLIGPRFYYVFTDLVKVLLYICTALIFINIIAKIADPNEVYISTSRLLVLMNHLSGWALKTLGVLVIVFAALEFGSRDHIEKSEKLQDGIAHPFLDFFGEKQKQESNNWDPKKLPVLGKFIQINHFNLIFRSAWLFFLIILFNFFPQWVGLFTEYDNGIVLIPFILVIFTGYILWLGIFRGMKLVLYLWLLFAFAILTSASLKASIIFTSLAEGQINFIPLLSEGFRSFIPWISIYWLLKLILTLWNLKTRENNNIERWANISLKIFGLLILVFIFSGPAIIGLNPEYLALHSIPNSTQDLLRNSVTIINSGINLIFVAGLYINVFLTIILVIKEIRGSETINKNTGLSSSR